MQRKHSYMANSGVRTLAKEKEKPGKWLGRRIKKKNDYASVFPCVHNFRRVIQVAGCMHGLACAREDNISRITIPGLLTEYVYYYSSMRQISSTCAHLENASVTITTPLINRQICLRTHTLAYAYALGKKKKKSLYAHTQTARCRTNLLASYVCIYPAMRRQVV